MTGYNIKATTVIAIKHKGVVAMAGDGQVTVGDTVLKGKAQKVRLIHNGQVLTGFAGATADALTLYERFEIKLKKHNGDILRSAVELAKEWRTDKALRKLEAFLLSANKNGMFLISGNGDVIEPDGNVLAIGSGGNYASAAALALIEHTSLSASEIAYSSLLIASRLCIYTNQEIMVKELK